MTPRQDSTPPALRGLASADAHARLARSGPNELPEPARRSRLRVVRDVLREPMLLLLLAAASVYVLLGDPQQAAVLSGSVVLVIWLTVRQEQRAERALQSLRDLARPHARVVRDGAAIVIPARDVVVGDTLLVSEGERVPADAWVVEETDLHVDESLLTGESVPIRRGASDRDDPDALLHASTLVVRGHGVAEVMATGAATAVGRIGASLHAIRPGRSPLQLELRRVVLLFAALAGLACVAVTAVYFATRGHLLDAALAGLTLAIATIPEEFPMVVTIFLAIGAWRLAQRQALVRHPAAIETLGSVSVLCVDKTGTLTENRMAVAETRPDDAAGRAADARSLLEVAALAARPGSQDPMDRALQQAAPPSTDTAAGPLRHAREYPLSPQCPAMLHVWTDGPHWTAACKGAPETVAALCRLPDADRTRVLADVESMARRGLRVLAVAEARAPLELRTALPDAMSGFDLAWRGLVGFADPLRPGIRSAVRQAQAAGIRVLMLTGDHVETARAIAGQAGIDGVGDGDGDGDILSGAQIDALDDASLATRLARTRVCARVRPEHKLRLVESLRRAGEVVAMTGDGINDAPALLASHVGIAMGGRGTDVAREAASIVLLDDDFVTIVGAIALGRRIYRNIRRAVAYILAVHVPIAGLAMLPLLAGGPLVLLPLHVVFLELIIDPACSIVFEQEAAEADAMQRPPRPASEHLLTFASMSASLLVGAAMFATVGMVYACARMAGIPDPQVAALAFTTLVVGNLALVVVFRGGATLFATLRHNSVAFSTMAPAALLLLLSVTLLPLPAHWFAFAPPPMAWWLGAALLPLPVAAVAKWGRHLDVARPSRPQTGEGRRLR